MTPSWYDVLGVAPDADATQIRAAWRAAIADLDPTDRRFAVLNQAAEVLLDPAARAAYDAELAVREPQEPRPLASAEPEPVTREKPREAAVRPAAARPAVPTWLLAGLAAVVLVVVGVAAYVWVAVPSDQAVEDATAAAQSAAERAVVPIVSYDYRHLDQDQAKAESYLTADYRKEYDDLFEGVIKENAPRTKTVVTAQVLTSGIVRSGDDRVQVFLFVNRPTTNKTHKQPVIYKDHVQMTMENVDGDWLVADLQT